MTPDPPPQSLPLGKGFAAILISILRIAFCTVTFFGSLIVFPEFLIWMQACWFLAALLMLWRNHNNLGGRYAAFLVLGCVIISIIKTPTWSVPFICMLGGSTLIAIGLLASQKPHLKVAATVVLVGLLGWFGTTRWLEANTRSVSELKPDGIVVCLGDSLTEFGYPEVLAGQLSIPVKNFGQNGLTAEAAIQQLPEIIAANPRVVILELGGHDFKNGKSRRQTRAWLVEIIETIRESGAQVILVEIPRGFVNDPYFGLERELAGEYDLQLIPDSLIRQFVFWSPIVPPGAWFGPSRWLSKDGLHPNQAGNELFVEYAKIAMSRVLRSSFDD